MTVDKVFNQGLLWLIKSEGFHKIGFFTVVSLVMLSFCFCVTGGGPRQ